MKSGTPGGVVGATGFVARDAVDNQGVALAATNADLRSLLGGTVKSLIFYLGEVHAVSRKFLL